jgi:hypothetical protein
MLVCVVSLHIACVRTPLVQITGTVYNIGYCNVFVILVQKCVHEERLELNESN